MWKKKKRCGHKFASRLRKLHASCKKQRHVQTRKRHSKRRVDWDVHVSELRDGEFKRRYRMTRILFQTLLTILSSVSTFFKINVENTQNVINLHGAESIDPRHKLAVAIRWFAGGSYLDIRLVHCMGRSTIYCCV